MMLSRHSMTSMRASAQPCPRRPLLSRPAVVPRGPRAFAEDNCITSASVQSIIAGAGGGTGGLGGSGSGSGGAGSNSNSGAGDAEGSKAHPMRIWTFVLAALLAVGGGIGFIRAGSPKSLTMGLSSALIMALAANSMVGPSALAGVRVAFGLTFMLGIFFVRRYSTTKKVIPAGAGAGVCLAYAAAFVANGL